MENAFSEHGNPDCNNDDSHVAISGTSMATPMVAGSAAILKQKYPNMKPAEIKSLFMLNSFNMGYSRMTQGTGRINVLDSLDSGFLNNQSTIIFREVSEGNNKAERLTFKNLKTEPLGVNLSVLNHNQEVEIKADPNSFTIPANGEYSINFTIEAIKDTAPFFEPETGHIIASSNNEAGRFTFSFYKSTNKTAGVFEVDEGEVFYNNTLVEHLSLGDFDNDGDEELMATSSVGGRMMFYEIEENTLINKETIYKAPGTSAGDRGFLMDNLGDISVKDINKDGKEDLVVGGFRGK